MGIPPITTPCLPRPGLRKHRVQKTARPKFKRWLEEQGGIVVYANYAADMPSNIISFSPLVFPAKTSNHAGDRYVWHENTKLTDGEGNEMIVATATREVKAANQKIVKQVAIDCIDPSIELMGDIDDIDALLESAFEWK